MIVMPTACARVWPRWSLGKSHLPGFHAALKFRIEFVQARSSQQANAFLLCRRLARRSQRSLRSGAKVAERRLGWIFRLTGDNTQHTHAVIYGQGHVLVAVRRSDRKRRDFGRWVEAARLFFSGPTPQAARRYRIWPARKNSSGNIALRAAGREAYVRVPTPRRSG